jgi:putative OPT family oligopeptide transporter
MAAVAGGVFGGGLPWLMVLWGMAVAVGIIALDVILQQRGSAFRTPVLAVAVGIYLPLELSTAIFIGGLIAWAAGRVHTRHVAAGEERLQAPLADARETGERHGLLFAAGLITGEALIGIMLAIPIVMAGRADVLAFWGEFASPWPGVVLLGLVMILLYRVASAPLRARP